MGLGMFVRRLERSVGRQYQDFTISSSDFGGVGRLVRYPVAGYRAEVTIRAPPGIGVGRAGGKTSPGVEFDGQVGVGEAIADGDITSTQIGGAADNHVDGVGKSDQAGRAHEDLQLDEAIKVVVQH